MKIDVFTCPLMVTLLQIFMKEKKGKLFSESKYGNVWLSWVK